MEDFQRTRSIIQNQEHEDLKFLVLEGAVNFKEENLTKAQDKFERARSMAG